MKQLNIKKLMAAYKAYDESNRSLKDIKRWATDRNDYRSQERLEIQTKTTNERKAVFDAEAAELNIRIHDVEGRASSRTITAETVCKVLEDIEDEIGIPKKYLNGITVVCDPNGFDPPSSYGYVPMSTIIYAEFKNGSWRINDLKREPSSRFSQAVRVNLTDEAKQAIINRFTIISKNKLR